MSLIIKAQDYIDNCGDLISLLKECIEERSLQALTAVQMLYEDMYGGVTFNMEEKSPAACCLVLWGENGIDALVEGATRTPKSKNISMTLEILSYLSVGEIFKLISSIKDTEIIEMIVQYIKTNAQIYDYARKKLNEFVLSFQTDEDAAFSVGSNISFHLGPNIKPIKQLFAALALRWIILGHPTIERYEELIKTQAENESVFQSFFEHFPQFLDPMTLQMWPKPDFHGYKEPDFVIRRTDNSYLIVEIEKPSKMIVTSDNKISSDVSEAVAQAMQYRTFLLERFSEAAKHFPNFQDPETLVVIGLENTLKDEQKKVLLMENQHRSKLKIVGFDWLMERALAINNNMIENKIEVKSLRMV